MPLTRSLLLSLGLALSASPSAAVADDTVEACVRWSGGAVRLVQGRGECRPHESALSWAARGGQGPAGDRGQAGRRGEPGRSIVLADATGERIGMLIDLLNTSIALMLSENDFSFLVETGAGAAVIAKELVFHDPECAGAREYLLASESFYALSRNFGTRGEVFRAVPDGSAGTAPRLYYIPRDAARVDGDFFLLEGDGRCVAMSGTGGFRSLPNDPAVTGLSRGEYPAPVSFGKQ